MDSILYYSKKCKYSKSMIIHISQSPVKNNIQFVCVDDLIKNGNLPSFIKSVPVIFRKDTNTLLKADQALEWIRSFNQESEGDIGGFDTFGCAYSGLSEEGYAGAFSTGGMYSYLENTDNEQNQINNQENITDMKKEKQKIIESAYDRMIAERQEIGQPIKRK